jgi:putative two-component system response regulator
MNYKILVVDDEPANLRLLERLFRRDHTVICAQSGAEALELLKLHDIALIISDQRMPGMTGIEFLKRAAELRPSTVRIILTGYTDVNALVEAINSSVIYKYVSKPWVNEDLQQTIFRAIEHYETIKNQHELKLKNDRLKSSLTSTREGFVRMISEMLEIKGSRMPVHARRTSHYAVSAGRQLNLQAKELEQLSTAAFLHEVGHIHFPDELLFKTTGLSDEERRLKKSYFEQGLQLFANVPEMEDVSSIIRGIHEDFDGGGYPDGLAGERIPLQSRILAVADAYDEMTSVLSSEPAETHAEAVKSLQLRSGTRFDPEVVETFCRLEPIGF